MSFIPSGKYEDILDVLPILCVDIVAKNARGKYLLIKRANEPKKNHWWVVGGRVLKNETLEAAAIRKMREEAGITITKARPIGYFELVNGVNPFRPTLDYHSVSVVFNALIDESAPVVLDKQSVGFRFADRLPDDFIVRAFA
jgi:colanic acid biosynthesis protein WcaH